MVNDDTDNLSTNTAEVADVNATQSALELVKV